MVWGILLLFSVPAWRPLFVDRRVRTTPPAPPRSIGGEGSLAAGREGGEIPQVLPNPPPHASAPLGFIGAPKCVPNSHGYFLKTSLIHV